MKIPVILIVEDEFIIATDIRMSLEAMGYKVCAIVSSGEEAIARTEKEKPDLVLMDVVLKGKLDGVEAAEQIRFLFNIPIIYLTAYTDGNTVERAKRTEPSGYIIKPFNDRELNTAIEIALYKHMAETKLRESEERFRTLFDQANDSIFVYDTKGNFHSVNPKAYLNLGYTGDELLQMRVSDVDLDFVPIEDETLFWDRLPISIERRCKRKDGSIFPADVRLSMIISHEQRFVLAFVNDITKRKEAEEELKKLSAAIRQSPVSIIICDLEGNIEYVNPYFCKLTGYSAQETKGKNPRILQSGTTSKETYRDLWQTIIACQEWHGEFHNMKKNGDLYWERVVISPILDKYGNITHFLGIKEDITEHKRIEAALQQSELKFRNLVEYSNDWIWEVNAEGIYTYSSPLVEEILGYKPEEILGKTPFDLMPPEEAGRIAEIFKSIAEKKESIIALVNINLHKNGQSVILETSGVPVLDKDGQVTHYRGVDRDITKRKQAEKEREELIQKLREALEKVKTLSGLLPICAKCKKIRDDKGYWNLLESYIEKHSEASFSHSLCPECSDELYGNEDWYQKIKEMKQKRLIGSMPVSE